MKHDPPIGPSHRPLFRDGGEALGPRGVGGDLHIDTKRGGMFDELLAVTAVDSHLGDAGMVGGDLV